MLATEHTFEGWQARVRPEGRSRYFGAAFLAFWLCGWAVGEVMVLGILAGGLWTLITGTPPHPHFDTVHGTAIWPVGAFLLLWLTLWTIGGITAGWTLLRLLWGEDRITLRADVLRVERRAAPLRRVREVRRDEVLRFYRVRAKGTQYQIVADTRRGPVVVTDLASPADLDALEPALARELRLTPERSLELPAGWEQVPIPEGGTAFVEAPARRRRLGWVVSLLAGTLALIALWSAATHQPIATVVCALGAGLIGWGAARLLLGRYEWQLAGTRLRLVWRYRDRTRTLCEGDRLRLRVTTDSDNDESFHLELIPIAGPATAKPRPRTIARALHSPAAPLALGEWLAQRTGLPLENSVPTAADKAEQIEAMRRKLEASGRFGRWMARLLPPARSGR